MATITPLDAMVLPARPYACVVQADEGSVRGMATGTGGSGVLSGVLELLIEADVSAGYVNDARNAAIEAKNALGNLVKGILAGADGDYLAVRDVGVMHGPSFIAKAEQNDNTVRYERWRALLRVEWGLNG